MSRLIGLLSAICLALFAACSTPRAELTFHKGTADGAGYDFVIPRTVVKIGSTTADAKQAAESAAGTPAKTVGTNSLSFTYVPLTSASDDAALPRFWVEGGATSGFALTPTSISSASYADNLVLSAIGTQVTDNRSTAIDAGVSILGVVASAVGLGFAAAQVGDCSKTPMPSFVLDSLDDVSGAFVPGTKCWGYNLKMIRSETANDPKLQPVSGLPLEQKVTWFPYPACRTVLITLYICDANSDATCTIASNQNPIVQTLNVSTGASYRKMLLPAKGKISFHSDFCGVDVTDDPSGVQSNWALLKQAVSDYNSLKQSKSTTSGK